MEDYKGCIIAESLDDPTIIKTLTVFKAEITKNLLEIDDEGNGGRWHIYYVLRSKMGIDELQPHILKGWYAHFWKGEQVIVVYHDEQFEIVKNDESTWKAATEHGLAIGIPKEQLDFYFTDELVSD